MKVTGRFIEANVGPNHVSLTLSPASWEGPILDYLKEEVSISISKERPQSVSIGPPLCEGEIVTDTEGSNWFVIKRIIRTPRGLSIIVFNPDGEEFACAEKHLQHCPKDLKPPEEIKEKLSRIFIDNAKKGGE